MPQDLGIIHGQATGNGIVVSILAVSDQRIGTAVDSFSGLLQQLRDGNDDGARIVFGHFTARLVELARARIDAGLKHKIAPEDIVQSAYRSFLRRDKSQQFQLKNWESMWGLLSLITLRKCARVADYHLADRRNAGRELSTNGSVGGTPIAIQLVDREPTSEDVAILFETVESVLCAFDDEDRDVVEMSLQGYSTLEISRQLDRAERSVRRLRERVRCRLERVIAADGKDDVGLNGS